MCVLTRPWETLSGYGDVLYETAMGAATYTTKAVQRRGGALRYCY